MNFHLGKPILVLAILSLASGLVIFRHKSLPRKDLVLWAFADSHVRTYRQPLPATQPGGLPIPSLIEQFENSTGKSVEVDLVAQRAEDVRLMSMFNSQSAGDEVPDLCEIETGSIGKFFRPQMDQIGLLPLNKYVDQLDDQTQVLPSRLAAWSKKDPVSGKMVIFGIPHDVHPMTITYRQDLFSAAGIDPSVARTWEQFQSLCLDLQRYRAAHGFADSYAIELPSTLPDMLMAMLLQRRINIIDASDKVHFDDPRVAQTIAFYAQLVAGPKRIGADLANSAGFGTRDIVAGDVCAICTPDWRAGYVKQYAPELAGKLRMMPLPVFDSSDAPTSTSGGTMIGIPRTCKNPDLAWKLIKLLYLTPESNRARVAAGSGILPAVKSLWNDPVYHQGDPFYGGQKVFELYIDLASKIPERYVTPYTTQGAVALALVLHRAENYVDANGTNGLENACSAWLADAQSELQRRIDFGKFEP